WTSTYSGKVHDELFAAVALSNPSSGDYTPTSNTATAAKVAGVFDDLNGHLRPTIGTSPGAWTAGAVQAADLLTFQDINHPIYPGSFSVNTPYSTSNTSSSYTLTAGGSDIYDGTQQFLLGSLNSTFSSDFDYAVQISSFSGPSG